jgi:hypothetical protein
MEEGKPFKIFFDADWYVKGDTLVTPDVMLLVLGRKRTWWKVLLQWLSFGWYKAPWYYLVKPIKPNEKKEEGKSST